MQRLVGAILAEPYRRFPWIGAVGVRDAGLGGGDLALASARVFRRVSR
ncbi:MAG: hypothetical protein H5U40_16510 [Polyangiaceae bacterium]|nr:hypothetical protein [Polyangiaceae bacterium]